MFTFNVLKAFETVLFFSKLEKEKNNSEIDLIKAHKYCYFSEQLHLQKYLQPIFGDSYDALREGPVPSQLYDFFKHVRGEEKLLVKSLLKTANIEKIPFEIIDHHFIISLRAPNIGVFSESETNVLIEIFNTYSDLTSKELSTVSHKDKAWRKGVLDYRNEMDFQEIIGDKEAWEYIKKNELESKSLNASLQYIS